MRVSHQVRGRETHTVDQKQAREQDGQVHVSALPCTSSAFWGKLPHLSVPHQPLYKTKVTTFCEVRTFYGWRVLHGLLTAATRSGSTNQASGFPQLPTCRRQLLTCLSQEQPSSFLGLLPSQLPRVKENTSRVSPT